LRGREAWAACWRLALPPPSGLLASGSLVGWPPALAGPRVQDCSSPHTGPLATRLPLVAPRARTLSAGCCHRKNACRPATAARASCCLRARGAPRLHKQEQEIKEGKNKRNSESSNQNYSLKWQLVFLTVHLCNQTSRFPINMLQFMLNFECSQKMVTDTQLVIPTF